MTRVVTAPDRRARAARRHTAIGVLVLVLCGLAAWISTVAIDGEPWSAPYQVRIALPPGAPLLTPGDDVRIGGERVGQVSSVTLASASRTRAIATLSLAGRSVGPGASARVRPRGLAGAVYVDLDPGRPGRALPSGSVLHETTGGVEVTDVIAGFDAATRRALQSTLNGDGNGVAGRGVQVGQTIGAAPAVLADATAVTRALTPATGVLSGLLGSAGAVTGAVAPVGSDALGGAVGAGRSVLSATAPGGLTASVRALPGAEDTAASVLPSADGLLSVARRAASVLTPGIAALNDALPTLRSLETAAPSVATLARVAGVASPALRELTPAFALLRGPAAGLTPLSDPVDELATVLIPYGTELVQAPLGFTRWGGFRYDFGTGTGHRAVRFSMVLTCAYARDPYPAPGAAAKEHQACR
ncbi:MAG TPA: MlaD family protein [Solirubrobacteraceae bacterium]|nr:MlaD family protein [Solirubrobacteraceae bacterium]